MAKNDTCYLHAHHTKISGNDDSIMELGNFAYSVGNLFRVFWVDFQVVLNYSPAPLKQFGAFLNLSHFVCKAKSAR